MNIYKIKGIISDTYYNIKHGIKNLFTYFNIVWIMRDWDTLYIFIMLQFQLKKLLKNIEEDFIVEGNRIKNENNIKKCIELLEKLIQDDYYLDTTKSIEELDKMCKNDRNKLFDILKKNIFDWWT